MCAAPDLRPVLRPSAVRLFQHDAISGGWDGRGTQWLGGGGGSDRRRSGGYDRCSPRRRGRDTAGSWALTPDRSLQGERVRGEDDYTGTYAADYEDFSGTELLFGGTTLNREAGNTVELTCSLDIEEGEAAIFLCSGSEEPVLLLSESGDYSGTIEVGGGSVYLGVWAVGVTGSVSIQIE